MTSTNGETKSRTRDTKDRDAKGSRSKLEAKEERAEGAANRRASAGHKNSPDKNESPRKTRAEQSRSRRGPAAADDGHPRVKDNEGDDTLSDSDESAVVEDVSVTVAGKKNAVRGKVWRMRNGDYVRYRCIDDGCEYRPGGKSTPHLIDSARRCSSQKRDTSRRHWPLMSRNLKKPRPVGR